MNYIKQFQKKHGLFADGIIGPNTAGMMQKLWKRNTAETAHILGQGFVESKQFTTGRENLNYSVKGLMNTFLFYRNNPDLAIKHGRNASKPADQVAIANTVYADVNRSEAYKLGNNRSGDGWNNRGVGGIQLTGKNNIEAFLKWKGLPIDLDRDVIERDYFWDTFLFYFETRVKWSHCQTVTKSSCSIVTKKVNGGYAHLDERTEATFKFYKLLK